MCKVFFQKALGIGTKRLNTVSTKISHGEVPVENRGGDRKSHKNQSRKASVCDFISKLPARESHYARNKSCRIYLSCELNVAKLCRLYNDSVGDDLKVKPWFFRQIFMTQFNIGFSSPASDACTTCVLLTNKITAEKN